MLPGLPKGVRVNSTLTPFGTNLSTGHLYSFKYSKISQKSVTDLGADLMCLRLPIQRSFSGAWDLRLPFKDTQTSLPHVLNCCFLLLDMCQSVIFGSFTLILSGKINFEKIESTLSCSNFSRQLKIRN